jgi:hypothetical protein
LFTEEERMKLSQEEQMELQEIVLSSGYPVLVKLIKGSAEPFKAHVLELDLGTGSRDELVDRKLRAEGAVQLARTLISLLEQTKRPPVQAKKARTARVVT